jgi:hypothetical protein
VDAKRHAIFIVRRWYFKEQSNFSTYKEGRCEHWTQASAFWDCSSSHFLKTECSKFQRARWFRAGQLLFRACNWDFRVPRLFAFASLPESRRKKWTTFLLLWMFSLHVGKFRPGTALEVRISSMLAVRTLSPRLNVMPNCMLKQFQGWSVFRTAIASGLSRSMRDHKRYPTIKT